jgi:hypothetical protein
MLVAYESALILFCKVGPWVAYPIMAWILRPRKVRS